jgi:hypothetical protein
MKKAFFAALAIVLFSGIVSNVSAAEVGSSALSSMGLGGMQTLSDSEGETVRGKGTSASVWGGSSAVFGTQSSQNSYQAGSSWVHKPARATGNSLSYAGTVNGSFAADPTGHSLSLSFCAGFAGGSASAKAW